MEIIKRKISLDNYTSRKKNTWGQMTATTFYVNIFFKQDMDDMGIGTDVEFTADTATPTIMNPYTPDVRYVNKTLSDYFTPSLFITGYTRDKLDLVKSYSFTQTYQPGLNMSNDTVYDYQGNSYTAVDRVVSDDNQMPITYVIGGDDSYTINPNNPDQTRGIFYKTYSGLTRPIVDSVNGNIDIPVTEMYYKGEGFNNTNTTLSAITKQEYLFGITTTPKVYSDVDIDRGINSAFQKHLQMGEIKNMSDLINYGNGYYKIIK